MPLRTKTDLIVVHCSATRPSMDIGASEIDDWHKARGWSGIGYHIVIRRNGAIERGRPIQHRGAHVKGYNSRSVGVCVVGGLGHDSKPAPTFTGEQRESLKLVLYLLKAAYPDAKVTGHRDLSPDTDGDGVVEKHEWLKDCPSFDVALFEKSGVFA